MVYTLRSEVFKNYNTCAASVVHSYWTYKYYTLKFLSLESLLLVSNHLAVSKLRFKTSLTKVTIAVRNPSFCTIFFMTLPSEIIIDKILQVRLQSISYKFQKRQMVTRDSQPSKWRWHLIVMMFQSLQNFFTHISFQLYQVFQIMFVDKGSPKISGTGINIFVRLLIYPDWTRFWKLHSSKNKAMQFIMSLLFADAFFFLLLTN